MNLIEKLKAKNIEVTQEMEEILAGDFISVQEHERKIKRVEEERDKFKQDYETASETLKGFEGKDFEEITRDRDEWKAKAEQAEKDYNAKIEKRDYQDAIQELTKDLKFTSNSAKKAFLYELESNPSQMRDGKVLGFDDFLKGYKESDSDAFVKEEEEHRSSFTTNMNQNGNTVVTGDPNKMDYATYKAWRKQNS